MTQLYSLMIYGKDLDESSSAFPLAKREPKTMERAENLGCLWLRTFPDDVVMLVRRDEL